MAATVSPLVQWVVQGVLVLMMLGLGSTLEHTQIRAQLKRPAPVGIGMLSQFGVMPLVSFALAVAFELRDSLAVGLICIGCCPGGMASNLMTYLGDGDVPLSLTMTFLSNVCAVFMLPLLLFVYASQFSSVTIPFVDVVLAMASTIVPILLGVYIRARSKRWARRCEVGGITTGALLIVGGGAVIAVDSPNALGSLTWQVVVCAVVLSWAGFVFGYALARATGQEAGAVRFTIAIETGIQNSALASAIVITSFDEPERSDVLLIPILYGSWTTLQSGLCVLVKRVLDWRRRDEIRKQVVSADVSTDEWIGLE